MKITKKIIMILKKNNLIIYLLLIAGCSTSSYKVFNSHEYPGRYELLVTPDRVRLECENLNTEDIVSYGFSILVLDDKNTVSSVVQTNRVGKSGCQKRIKEVSKILKRGSQIYIAGIGDLEETRKKLKSSYFFPKHGTFYDNGRVLQFHAVSNEHGDCFDAYHGKKAPCPREEFPIKK